VNQLLQVRDFFIFALKHPKMKMAFGTALGLGALDLLVLAFFWWPSAYQHHQWVKKTDDCRREQLEAGRAQETALRYGKLSKRVRLLETKWETAATQSALIESINRLASKDGLRVVSQDFEMENAKSGGKSLKQGLSLTGSYGSLKQFLADLENLKTLTVVEQARLERAGEGGSRVQAVLKLRTFSRPVSGKRS
jgi:Tfp pilus assembly protein PilO